MKLRLYAFLSLTLLSAQPYKDLEGHTGSIYALAFSADSRYLFTASSDRTVRCWHLPIGTPCGRYHGANASLNALVLFPSDREGAFKIWAASSSGRLYQWESEAKGPLPAREEPLLRRLGKGVQNDPWEALVAHPEKPILYALSRSGHLAAWDYEENWLQSFQDTAGVAYSLLFHPQAKLLYLGSGSGVILGLHPQEMTVRKILRGHTKGVRGLALSPDQRTLASAGLDGKVFLWTVPEGLRVRSLEGHSDGVRAVAFSPDGRYLASAGKDGKLCLWYVASGRLEKTINLGVPLWTVAFSPNGQYLIAGGEGGLLRIWRIDQLGIRPIQLIAETDSLYLPPLDLLNDLPHCSNPRPNRYAFIVGNEDYRSYQPTLSPAMNVPYALKDAYTFRMYAEQILGVPAQNIVLLKNATSAQIRREMEKLLLLMQVSGQKAEVFFYYAGHGVPHPQTQESYLLPVDVSPNLLDEGGIRLTEVVERLGNSGAGRVWLIVDACFSGGARQESPIAARGIRLKPKPVRLSGPVVLISATTAEEEALPYHQASYGLFTYFFLKALRTAGCQGAPLRTILQNAATETTRYALLLHNKPQRPSWVISPELSEEAILNERW
ncbi:MAG: caspase family protein [Bacteroidia bacterium]|nr:caspase family protein [Bacteroidia bacterium]MDW8088927.1 caspase family protein [Bacteroidia bacterium]